MAGSQPPLPFTRSCKICPPSKIYHQWFGVDHIIAVINTGCVAKKNMPCVGNFNHPDAVIIRAGPVRHICIVDMTKGKQLQLLKPFLYNFQRLFTAFMKIFLWMCVFLRDKIHKSVGRSMSQKNIYIRWHLRQMLDHLLLGCIEYPIVRMKRWTPGHTMNPQPFPGKSLVLQVHDTRKLF